MGRLKLVIDNTQKNHQPGSLGEILSLKDWSEEEIRLLEQLDEYSSLLKLRRADPNGQVDYSKHFIIFSYNYYELNLLDKAREMLFLVTDRYFLHEFVKDMEEAVEHRNLANEWERKRDFKKANEHSK